MAEQIFVALYTDADVTPKLARLLQERGFDAISTQEMGKFESPDVEQLVYAAGQGRAILTYNSKDFEPLYQEWWWTGHDHFGIIVSEQLPVGELLHRVLLISDHLLAPTEAGFAVFDVVHANAEFPPAARATDHDPSLLRFTLESTPANVTLTNLTAGPVISIGRRSRQIPRRARPPRSQPFRIMPGPIARRGPCRCG